MGVLRFIEHSAEFRPKRDITKVPEGVRGIYALLQYRPDIGPKKFEVVYIGMARRGNAGVKARLAAHERSRRKRNLWSHFSVYSVWPNITDDEVAELEGLFRHIFRRDPQANKIAVQKSFAKLKKTKNNNFRWNRRSG